jgi:hypothetical protein
MCEGRPYQNRRAGRAYGAGGRWLGLSALVSALELRTPPGTKLSPILPGPTT